MKILGGKMLNIQLFHKFLIYSEVIFRSGIDPASLLIRKSKYEQLNIA